MTSFSLLWCVVQTWTSHVFNSLNVSASVTGQVPILEVDGQQLGQSVAIARYLANQFGLAGKDDWEKAEADMYVDGISDLVPHARPAIMALMGTDKEKGVVQYMYLSRQTTPVILTKTAFGEFKNGALKDMMDKFEKFIVSNGTGYLVGSGLTWADIILAELMDRMTGFDKDVLANHATLKKHHDMVHNQPNIKTYVASRPQSVM